MKKGEPSSCWNTSLTPSPGTTLCPELPFLFLQAPGHFSLLLPVKHNNKPRGNPKNTLTGGRGR